MDTTNDTTTDDRPDGEQTANEAGLVVADAAEVYERFFVPALFGDWPPILLDRAGVAPGDRVLDVGTGTGVVARAAADRVGPGGSVIGLDPNPGMLAVAAASGAPVEWREGAAESIPLADDHVDHVLSQFALMFFADRAAGLAEMARVARPGGRITVATWASLADTPGYAAMEALLDRLFGPEVASAIGTPYVLGDPTEVAGLLSPHVDGVEVEQVDGVARFASIDEWVHTDIRGWTLADVIDDAQYEVLAAEARRELAPFTDDTGAVRFAAPALIATGRVPA